MFGDGDSAAHYSNGVTAKRYREATDEERATYRRWMRGIIVFYLRACVDDRPACGGELFGRGPAQLTNLSVRPVATSPRAN